MDVVQMRIWLKKQYGGAPGWVARVNKMHDNQVIAVYYRMVRSKQ